MVILATTINSSLSNYLLTSTFNSVVMRGGLNQSDGYIQFSYSVIVFIWMHSYFESIVFTHSPTGPTYKRCTMPGSTALSDLTVWVTGSNTLAIRNDGTDQFRYVAIKVADNI